MKIKKYHVTIVRKYKTGRVNIVRSVFFNRFLSFKISNLRTHTDTHILLDQSEPCISDCSRQSCTELRAGLEASAYLYIYIFLLLYPYYFFVSTILYGSYFRIVHII